jgi:hypothetical protein
MKLPFDTKPVTYADCPYGGGNRCRCGKCSICGHQHHVAIHGPVYDNPEKFWGHAFYAIEIEADAKETEWLKGANDEK